MGNLIFVLTSNVVDIFLVFLHSCHVILQRCHVIPRGRGLISQKIGQLGAVDAVFMNTKLDVLAKLFVKLLVIVLVLCDLSKQLQTLLDKVFPDHFQNFVLL